MNARPATEAPLAATPRTATPRTATPRTGRSYDPTLTCLGGLGAELDRLEQQAELTAEAELGALFGAGLRDGQRVLDLGCGSGAFSRRLRAALPSSRILGADLDQRLLRRASGPVIQLDAGRLPLAPGSVDVVLVRYVAQHLEPADRATVWRQARRVLGPDGMLVVIDVDDARWGRVSPPDPGLSTVFRRLAERRAAAAGTGVAGGDRFVIRVVPAELTSAGFAEVTTLIARCTNDQRPLADFAVHLGPQRYLRELSDGILSVDELARIAAGWRRLQQEPTAGVEIDVHLVRAQLRSATTERIPP